MGVSNVSLPKKKMVKLLSITDIQQNESKIQKNSTDFKIKSNSPQKHHTYSSDNAFGDFNFHIDEFSS